MRLYQLEYDYEASYSKLRRSGSFFYRPEYIVDGALWKAVRQGNDINTDDDIRRKTKKSAQELEQERKNKLRQMIDSAGNTEG